LDNWNQRRHDIAQLYVQGLSSQILSLPHVPSWAGPAWHLFVIRTRERKRLIKALSEAAIESGIHYPVPPHLQTAYDDFAWKKGSFPITETIHDEVLSLPIYPQFGSERAGYVISKINEIPF